MKFTILLAAVLHIASADENHVRAYEPTTPTETFWRMGWDNWGHAGMQEAGDHGNPRRKTAMTFNNNNGKDSHSGQRFEYP
jgi:hypothetical protein